MEEEREEGGKGGVPSTGRSTPTREEEASAPNKGKGIGRTEEAEESRGRKSGMRGQAMKCIARMEEELDRKAKEESGRALWKEGPRRSATVGLRMVYEGGSSLVPSLHKMRRARMLCKRQSGPRSDIKEKIRAVKLVWMPEKKRGRNGTAQKDKGVARQHTVGRTRKCSKRGG